jgi:hypothetical protein
MFAIICASADHRSATTIVVAVMGCIAGTRDTCSNTTFVVKFLATLGTSFVPLVLSAMDVA